jgi:hypothetical protein
MSTELIESPQHAITSSDRPWWCDGDAFSQIQRAATLFSASTLVPKDYQGKAGLANCVIALNMSHRMQADPLMVMQNLYVVHGRPSWSSQFLIACFNQTGRFTPIRYTWSGTEGKDDWGCTAWSTDRDTRERIEGPLVTIETAKKEGWYGKNGSKWQTIPRLMLMYRAAAWLVRTHAPELAMGLQTAEESQDIDTPAPSVPFASNGSRRAQVSALLGESASEATAEAAADTAAPEFAPAEGEDGAAYMKRLRNEIARAGSAEAVNAIVSAAEAYAGGDFLSEDDFGKLTEQANTRVGEILKSKASGKLA